MTQLKLSPVTTPTFVDRLFAQMLEKKTVLCVGLDPQIFFVPPHILAWALKKWGNTVEAVARAFLRFNCETIDAVHEFVVAAKPQIAFYEEYGHWGLWALEETIAYARAKGLIVITDAKRGDGGDTAKAYARGHIGKIPMIQGDQFSPLRVDCVTIHGYIGKACVSHFVEQINIHGTGALVVDKTSFAPNSAVEQLVLAEGIPVWQALARLVDEWGRGTEGACGYRNLGVVMGATYPEDAPAMRKILPNSPFLIPGYGEQGGGADAAITGFNDDGLGGVVNSARAIQGAWQKGRFTCTSARYEVAMRQSAEFSRDDLNAALKRAGKLGW